MRCTEPRRRGETFLLSPEIAQAIAKDVKRITLKLAIDRQGNLFLWPVPPVPEEGNDNP